MQFLKQLIMINIIAVKYDINEVHIVYIYKINTHTFESHNVAFTIFLNVYHITEYTLDNMILV